MVVLRAFQKLQLNCVNGCYTLRSEPGNRRQTICSKSGACKLANRADTGDAVKSKLELYCEIRFVRSNKMEFSDRMHGNGSKRCQGSTGFDIRKRFLTQAVV